MSSYTNKIFKHPIPQPTTHTYQYPQYFSQPFKSNISKVITFLSSL